MDPFFIVLILAVGAFFFVKHLLSKVYPPNFGGSISSLVLAPIVLLLGLYITFDLSGSAERAIDGIIKLTTFGTYVPYLGSDAEDMYNIGKSMNAFDDSGMTIPKDVMVWAGLSRILGFIVVIAVLVLCFIMFRRLFNKNRIGIDAMRIIYVVSGVLMVVSIFISLTAFMKVLQSSGLVEEPNPVNVIWAIGSLVVLAVVFVVFNNALLNLYPPSSSFNTTTASDSESQPATSFNASSGNPLGGVSKRTLWIIIGVLGAALLILLAKSVFSSSDSFKPQFNSTDSERYYHDDSASAETWDDEDYSEQEDIYVPSSMAADVLTDILSLDISELDPVHYMLERNGYSFIAPTLNGRYYTKNCDCDVEERYETLFGADEEETIVYECTPKNIDDQSVFVCTECYRGPANVAITVWGIDNYNRLLEIIQDHGYQGEAGENGISFESSGKPSIYLYQYSIHHISYQTENILVLRNQ